MHKIGICEVCGMKTSRRANRYCSSKCLADRRYFEYIEKWKAGLVSGSRGVKAKNISAHIRRYLLERSKNKCTICSWDKQNSITGKVPLEVDHIDGNSENNREENLRLVCPNCHSLSPNFRNLNYGNGRVWRKVKYIKN